MLPLPTLLAGGFLAWLLLRRRGPAAASSAASTTAPMGSLGYGLRHVVRTECDTSKTPHVLRIYYSDGSLQEVPTSCQDFMAFPRGAKWIPPKPKPRGGPGGGPPEPPDWGGGPPPPPEKQHLSNAGPAGYSLVSGALPPVIAR